MDSMLSSDPERSWFLIAKASLCDESFVDLSFDAILDDEALPFSGASPACHNLPKY